MSFALLHHDRVATLGALGPVVKAADAGTLHDALSLLAEARALRNGAAAQAQAAADEARREGHAEGLAEGRRAGQADVSALLFELNLRAAAERRVQRAEVATLALEALRRIAGDLGAPDVVAGLAANAAAALLPEQRAEVRVAPEALERVSARMAALPDLHVVADPGLAPFDCVIETALGRTLAGLDVQVARIAQRWAELSAADTEDGDGEPG